MKTVAAITLVLLVAVIGLVAWHAATFDAYSRDFGTLTPARFEALNARMDALEKVTRVGLVALAAADLVLIVAAARRRARVALGLGIALAIVLVLLVLIARVSVGATMIGCAEARRPHLLRPRDGSTEPRRTVILVGGSGSWSMRTML